MKAIAALIAAIFQALFGALTYPLRLLGWEPRPTAAAVADTAVQAIREDPLPVIATPAPTPMADLVAAHARRRLYTHERHEAVPPLPPALEAWLDNLERLHDFKLTDVVAVSPSRLQRHINAGLAGSTALGPYYLPPVLPHAVPTQAKRGATGGTGGPSRDLQGVLDDLGLVFEASYSPRPR